MTDRYFTQNGSGLKNGLSYANAYAVSEYGTGWFMDFGSAGDVCYLCGTITGNDFGASHTAFPQLANTAYIWACDHPTYPGEIICTTTNYCAMMAFETTAAFTLRNIKISGSVNAVKGTGGIYLIKPTNVIISGGTMSLANASTIHLLDPINVTVDGASITNRTSHGIWVRGHAARAASGVTISGCTVYDCDNKAIWLVGENDVGQVTNCTIKDNVVTGSGDGIYLAGVSNSVISGNICTDNDNTNDAGSENYGIAVQQCQGLTISSNRITGGAGGRSGMEVWGGNAVIGVAPSIDIDCTGIKVIANYISGYMGPWIDTSGGNAFKACTAKSSGILICGNIFANSLRGVRIGQDGTSASILANNTFENCTTDLYLENNIALSKKATGWSVKNNAFTGTTWFDEAVAVDNSVAFAGNSYDAGTSGTYNGTTYTTADVSGLDATKDTAAWISGVRAYDDLPLPLHPDIGAVQDRTAPGRRFGVGGGTL